MEISEDGNRNSISGQTTTPYSCQATRPPITLLLGAFEKKHGNLLSILEIEVQPTTLEALVQYYDPPYCVSPSRTSN
ncbi:hypothetical protein CR513_38878, partial [Mucuna pruriens]